MFAEFYLKLYTASTGRVPVEFPLTMDNAFTMCELKHALKSMKRGKAQNEAFIVVNMMKDGTNSLLQCILEIFNDVLDFRDGPPSIWEQTRLTVILKKGDQQLP